MSVDFIDAESKFGIVPISLPTHFPVGPVVVYLLKNGPLTLVDTGLNTDENYEQLTAALRAQGVAISDLERIIITHGHRDHNGMLGRLLEESNATSYGHPEVAEQGKARPEDGEARKAFFVGILHEFGVPDEICEQANSLYDRFRSYALAYELDHVVEDNGKALDYDTYFVPGHSASDTLFVHESKDYTIVGDHLLQVTNPNPLLRRPRAGEERAKSLVEFQASLRRSRELELGICLPGHGPPFADHRSVVDTLLSKHAKRGEQVRALMASGHNTPYAVSKSLFPDLPDQNLHLGLSIAVGHMEVLESQGEAFRETGNGILHFHLA